MDSRFLESWMTNGRATSYFCKGECMSNAKENLIDPHNDPMEDDEDEIISLD